VRLRSGPAGDATLPGLGRENPAQGAGFASHGVHGWEEVAGQVYGALC